MCERLNIHDRPSQIVLVIWVDPDVLITDSWACTNNHVDSHGFVPDYYGAIVKAALNEDIHFCPLWGQGFVGEYVLIEELINRKSFLRVCRSMWVV